MLDTMNQISMMDLMNTRTKSKRLPDTDNVSTEHAFGVSDSKGRALGTVVSTYGRTYVLCDSDAGAWYAVAPGSYFGFSSMSTRGGLPFGASSADRLFSTAAKRDAAVEAYLKAAAKRAAKIAA